jgi:hypothetical protein
LKEDFKMAVISLLTKAYAVNIYRYGNRTFASIPAEYHEPVKQYAGENFTLYDIDQALAKGYITEQEYSETLAYVPEEPTA